MKRYIFYIYLFQMIKILNKLLFSLSLYFIKIYVDNKKIISLFQSRLGVFYDDIIVCLWIIVC
jgi:hypothetical protein